MIGRASGPFESPMVGTIIAGARMSALFGTWWCNHSKRWFVALTFVATFSLTAESAYGMQVQANPSTDGHTLGTRADIHQPAVTWNGTYPRVYYVATTLPDHSFL